MWVMVMRCSGLRWVERQCMNRLFVQRLNMPWIHTAARRRWLAAVVVARGFQPRVQSGFDAPVRQTRRQSLARAKFLFS
jgi:hypothetical protein